MCTKDEYTIYTGLEKLDLTVVHGYLSRSYWAEEIPLETVRRACANSICFNLYCKNQQIGFTRVISDRTTYAYVCDVFVLEDFRGKGLSKWMMDVMMAHPELQGLKRWSLVTRDAHGLYKQIGFDQLEHPEYYMEIARMGIYKQAIKRQ